MNNQVTLEDRWHDLLFGVRRSVRYHIRRRQFFERWHMATSGMAVIFGSATIASLLTNIDSRIALWAAGLVTVLASVDLIVGTSKMAWLHADLGKRFIELEKQILSAAESEDNWQAFNATRLDIEMEEPPVLHVLNMLCHNELVRALGYEKEHAVEIKWYQRWLANIVDIDEHSVTLG